MPAAGEGNNKVQAGCLEGMHLRRAVMPGGRGVGRTRVRLTGCTPGGHGNIVALERNAVSQKEIGARLANFEGTEGAGAAYHAVTS
jgi:hypothetical protein